MSRIGILIMIAAFAGCCPKSEPIGIQKTKSLEGMAAERSDKAQLEQLINSMWQALARQDQMAFEKLCTPDWDFYTNRGNVFTSGKLFEMHKANIKDFSLTIMDIRIISDPDSGWASYRGQMKGLLNGETWGGEFLFTQIFARGEDGRWLCAHLHESKKQ